MKTQSSNLPRWRDGFKGSNGKQTQGFWYVWHEGKQINLSKFGAPRENKNKANYAQALEARSKFLEALGVAQVEAKKEQIEKANHFVSVYDVCRFFVKHRLPSCSEHYQRNSKRHLENFCDGETGLIFRTGDRMRAKYAEQDGKKYAILPYAGWGNLPASKLNKAIVKQWVERHPNWNTSGTRNALCILKAAFRFAYTEDTEDSKPLLESNPLATLKAPSAAKREAEISKEQDEALRAVMPSALLELYSALWDLGARPGELMKLQAHHFNAKTDEFVLKSNEWKNGKKTNQSRYIALTPAWAKWAKARIADLDGEDGNLFVNSQGRAWLQESAESAFRRARERSGVPENLCLYSVRHGWITRALLTGVAVADAANQAGTSVSMIQQVYSKMHLHPESRRKAVLAVAGC